MSSCQDELFKSSCGYCGKDSDSFYCDQHWNEFNKVHNELLVLATAGVAPSRIKKAAKSWWDKYHPGSKDRLMQTIDENKQSQKEAFGARLSGESNEWYTPPSIIERVHAYFGSEVFCDPATIESNPLKAQVYYTKETNGLTKEWPANVYINPPYSGGGLVEWSRKISEQAERGVTIIALLPCGSRFSTKYYQTNVFTPELKAICFIRGRVKFVSETGEQGGANPYDSKLVMWNGNWDRFKGAFAQLGRCLRVEEVV